METTIPSRSTHHHFTPLDVLKTSSFPTSKGEKSHFDFWKHLEHATSLACNPLFQDLIAAISYEGSDNHFLQSATYAEYLCAVAQLYVITPEETRAAKMTVLEALTNPQRLN